MASDVNSVLLYFQTKLVLRGFYKATSIMEDCSYKFCRLIFRRSKVFAFNPLLKQIRINGTTFPSWKSPSQIEQEVKKLEDKETIIGGLLISIK